MFSAKHLKIGSLGETVACQFLKEKKYKIIERNYSKPWGEIDIIAQKKPGTLVFVEVKTIRQGLVRSKNQEFGNTFAVSPEDNLTSSKLAKLQKICLYYANENQALIKNTLGWQIDLITVRILEPNSYLTKGEKDYVIGHYENISSE